MNGVDDPARVRRSPRGWGWQASWMVAVDKPYLHSLVARSTTAWRPTRRWAIRVAQRQRQREIARRRRLDEPWIPTTDQQEET